MDKTRRLMLKLFKNDLKMVFRDSFGSWIIWIKDLMLKTFWTPTYSLGWDNAETSHSSVK